MELQFTVVQSHTDCTHFLIRDDDAERLHALKVTNGKVYNLFYDQQENEYYIVNDEGVICPDIDVLIHVKMLRQKLEKDCDLSLEYVNQGEDRLNKEILPDIKRIDRERIQAALDQGNRHDANILLKYSSLTRTEFNEILDQHPLHQEHKASEAWRNILDVISMNVAAPAFDTWFRYTDGIIQDDSLTIYCSNEFQRDWLDQHYRKIIEEAIEEVTGGKYTIVFKMKEE